MDQASKSRWLVGGRIAVDASTAVRADIELSQGCIRRIVYGDSGCEPWLDLSGYLLLPGLINSHDHLEFNLFPRLGRGPYPNAQEWARDIYHPEQSPIVDHLTVPKTVRLWWGGLKNLLSGATTVCHHNPYDAVFQDDFPVQVVRRYGWAHSIAYEPDIVGAFRATSASEPFIIHAAEGTDESSTAEVFELDRLGVLDHHTVLVHGVGINEDGHALLSRRGTAIVWCPTSNKFTLGRTLTKESLGNFERIALGSDSALTGQGDLLDEIHAAHDEGVAPEIVFKMVTETASEILSLSAREGTLRPGAACNLIAMPWKDTTPAAALVGARLSNIDMVMVSGRLQLASCEVRDRCADSELVGFECLRVDGIERWVRAPIRWLLDEASASLGTEIHLAGRKVSA